MARGAPCPVHYFAKQVMDWKPLQTIVLQMALVPIDHPGRLAPDIGINGIVGRVAQTERVTIGRGRAFGAAGSPILAPGSGCPCGWAW